MVGNGPRMIASCPIAKGVHIEIWVNESQPEDAIDRKWSLTVYDGKPDSMVFKVPPHWHKHHDEHMTVIEGEADFYIEGKHTRLGKGGQIVIPRRLAHWVDCIQGTRLVLKEATDPTGDFKEEFFLDMFTAGWPPQFWHIHRTFWDGDTYAALGAPWFLGGKIIDQAYIAVVGGLAKLVAAPKLSLEDMRKMIQ